MNQGVYVVIDTITVVLSLVLMFMALSGGGVKIRVNRLYAIFAVALALWLPAIHIGNNLSTPVNVALVANYIVFSCSFLVSVMLLKIASEIADISFIKRIIKYYEIILWPFTIVSATPLVGMGIEPQDEVNGVVFGPLGGLYGILLTVNILLAIFTIIWGIKHCQGLKKVQLKTVGWGILITMPLVMVLSFILPVLTGNFVFTEFGATPSILMAISLYYATIRHQLFDIKQATMRTVGYALTVATMAGIYVALAYTLSLVFFRGQVVSGISFSPLNIILALVIALVFQPIKRFFDRITNRIFYRNEYDRDTFFMEFGKILSHDTDLKLLLREASHYLAINMKAEYASFYLLNLGIYGNGQTKKANFRRKEINVLTGYVQAKLLGAEAVSEDMLEAGDAKEVLEKHKIKIFMPLMAQKEVFGYLLLGEHKSRGYSRRDLTVLNSIANELSIAIQNSMSVEEIRELNATLQQKIDDATNELRTKNRQLQRLDEVKDEFLSIASHQLRTPLTSIKGYVDMLLEGDFGEVSGRQREVLDDIFTSSERMVQLINDFLNVSRIQTGKFALERRPTDLEELIEKEIKLMSASLEQRNLKIDWQCDEMMPLLNVDTDKIRQVVVNMIDNAVYYSRPNSTIKVKLDKEFDNLIFTVTDTGIGVPAKDQANLFGKFFRASNARKRRPDGTGVGLYLAKKIIDTHGGEIIFKSVEGEGSTFGFKLPLVA